MLKNINMKSIDEIKIEKQILADRIKELIDNFIVSNEGVDLDIEVIKTFHELNQDRISSYAVKATINI